MVGLSPEEQLRIANSGGLFQETGQSSWVGTKVRKGDREGIVTRDMNGAYRLLTVRFPDGEEVAIRMNNVGFHDPEYIHEYEWFCKSRGVWYRF